jgi:hypothetical protein
MKKIMTSTFLVIFIVSAVMTAIPAARAAESKETEREDSVFQKASDVINGKYEVKTVPAKKIRIFQIIADKITQVEKSQ